MLLSPILSNKLPFYSERKGVATVEFALVFIPFIMLVLFTMELSRVIYLYASIDLSLSEASQQTSLAGNSDMSGFDYGAAFNSAFRENIKNSPLLSKGDTLNVTVRYCADIDAIISNTCTTDSSIAGMPLAVYSVVYNYKPVFFIFPDKLVQKSLTRNLVYVQEYERAL